MAARHPCLDPVVDTQMIKRVSGGLVPVPQCRITGVGEILLGRVTHRAEIDVGLRDRIAFAKEPIAIGRARRLGGQQVGDAKPNRLANPRTVVWPESISSPQNSLTWLSAQ